MKKVYKSQRTDKTRWV